MLLLRVCRGWREAWRDDYSWTTREPGIFAEAEALSLEAGLMLVLPVCRGHSRGGGGADIVLGHGCDVFAGAGALDAGLVLLVCHGRGGERVAVFLAEGEND